MSSNMTSLVVIAMNGYLCLLFHIPVETMCLTSNPFGTVHATQSRKGVNHQPCQHHRTSMEQGYIDSFSKVFNAFDLEYLEGNYKKFG